MISGEFLLTSLLVVLAPGTGVMYTVSTSLFGGWRSGFAAALGCTSGIVPHLVATALGLAALLHVSALAFQAFKLAGAAYLLYLAWGLWRENGALSFRRENGLRGYRRIAMRAFLINILNPKLSLFFLAFLPQFVNLEGHAHLARLLSLGGVFMLMTLAVFLGYAATASRLRSNVMASPRMQRAVQRCTAALFALLGLRLALADR